MNATSEIQTQNQNYNMSCPNEQEFFSDRLCRDTVYQLSLPSSTESNTILLNVRQFVVLEIDEKARRMEVNVKFTMQWHDSRITLIPSASNNNTRNQLQFLTTTSKSQMIYGTLYGPQIQ